jgi:hypothetical protein
MAERHPNELMFRDGTAHRFWRSGYRAHAGLDAWVLPIETIRAAVAAGGGMGPAGDRVLPILEEAGAEEPAWPAPGDALDDLAAAVVELRVEIHALRDDRPAEPMGRIGTVRAWGLRHAELCGWASRMGLVGDPRLAGSPLLAEAIALGEELITLAEAARPKAHYRVA